MLLVDRDWREAQRALTFTQRRRLDRDAAEAARRGGAFVWGDVEPYAIDPMLRRLAAGTAVWACLDGGARVSPSLVWFVAESSRERAYVDRIGGRDWDYWQTDEPIECCVDVGSSTIRLHADLTAEAVVRAVRRGVAVLTAGSDVYR